MSRHRHKDPTNTRWVTTYAEDPDLGPILARLTSLEGLYSTVDARLRALEEAPEPPPDPEPTPPTGTVVSQTITNGSLLAGRITWLGTAVPAPAYVEFLVDGVVKHTETAAPYQFGGDPSGQLDTATLPNGTHAFLVRAMSSGASILGQSSVVATVDNAVVVPPDPSPYDPAFLARPDLPKRGSSTQDWATYDSPTDLAIENVRVRGLGANKRAIVIRNPRGVLVLRDIDFQDVGICILIQTSTSTPFQLFVEGCRVQGILGPSHDAARARTRNMANFIQMDNGKAKGRIGDNRIIAKGTNGAADCEDIISITGASGGWGANEWLVIEKNQLDGTGTFSWSGSGIAASDGTGGYTAVQDNILLNPGQVGAFFASGGPGKMLRNVIYGRGNPESNQPWYVSKYGSIAPHDIEVAFNKTDWINKSGQKVGGYRGEVGANVSIHDNDWQTAIDPATLKVVL